MRPPLELLSLRRREYCSPRPSLLADGISKVYFSVPENFALSSVYSHHQARGRLAFFRIDGMRILRSPRLQSPSARHLDSAAICVWGSSKIFPPSSAKLHATLGPYRRSVRKRVCERNPHYLYLTAQLPGGSQRWPSMHISSFLECTTFTRNRQHGRINVYEWKSRFFI